MSEDPPYTITTINDNVCRSTYKSWALNLAIKGSKKVIAEFCEKEGKENVILSYREEVGGIIGGNFATIFFLKTKEKGWGYTEKIDTSAENHSNSIEVVFVDAEQVQAHDSTGQP